jgi:hypothetical protein
MPVRLGNGRRKLFVISQGQPGDRIDPGLRRRGTRPESWLLSPVPARRIFAEGEGRGGAYRNRSRFRPVGPSAKWGFPARAAPIQAGAGFSCRASFPQGGEGALISSPERRGPQEQRYRQWGGAGGAVFAARHAQAAAFGPR